MTLSIAGVQPHHVGDVSRSLPSYPAIFGPCQQPIGDFRVMTAFRLALAALSLSVLAGPVHAAETTYPLKLNNCGREITIPHAPARTVSVGQSSTEILYLLGVADKVVGTALWVGPVLKGYEDVNAKIKRLADNDPSFESVVGEKPDLVTTQFQWQIGPEGVVAKPEQFEELGIPVYTSPADCVGKDNSGGGDGTRTAKFTMDLVYQEIEELAQIFDVQDRGDKLVADLKAREEGAKKKIGAISDVSAVFWFSSATPMSLARAARLATSCRRSA